MSQSISQTVPTVASAAETDSNFGMNTSNYTKFAIVGRSRVGSNMLRSYLNSHPSIQVEGEVFGRLGSRDEDEVWNTVFSHRNRRVKAVGFKIFYYHPMDRPSSRVWDRLATDPEVKIIHLVRENILRILVSQKIAQQTGAWSNVQHGRREPRDRRVYLSVKECQQTFQTTRNWVASCNERFHRNDVLNLRYEDICLNPIAELNRIQGFLGCAAVELKSRLHKQNPESLCDLVANFDELRAAFAATEWRSFFLESD